MRNRSSSDNIDVEHYLDGLPAERQDLLQAVRSLILNNLDGEIAEGIQYGMIGYYVPHSVYPAGYHVNPKQPLPFAALASQKNYASLYLMFVYAQDGGREAFEKRWRATGKKLDMGKSCLHFTHLDQLALDVLADAFRSMTARKYTALVDANLSAGRAKGAKKAVAKPTQKPTAKKTAKKPTAKKTAQKPTAKKTAQKAPGKKPTSQKGAK
jgi:hypothetical protein